MNKLLYLALTAALVATPAAALGTLIDVAGNGKTIVAGANSAGAVTGTYFGHPTGAYVRYGDGSLATFAGPNAIETRGLGINLNDRVVGAYTVAREGRHGFVYEPDGTFTTIDFPGTNDTVLASINLSGYMAGLYTKDNVRRSFLRHPDGTFETFKVPGSKTMHVADINDSGVSVGNYVDKENVSHGFRREMDGTFQFFDSVHWFGAAGQLTPTGITNSGIMVGKFMKATPHQPYYGFLLNPLTARFERAGPIC